MSIQSRWRLCSFLYLQTAAIVFPIALLLCWNAYTEFREREEDAARQVYYLAQLTADNTEAFIADARTLLGTLAERIRSRRQSVAGCDPVFAEFRRLNPRFANFNLASADGHILCSSVPERDGRQAYVGATEWFRLVHERKELILSPPFRGIVTGRMVSVLSQPILDSSGLMTGSLQLPIDLANFHLIPGSARVPESITISIFDANGVMIARSHDPERFIGRDYRGTEAVDLFLRQKSGTGKALALQGGEKIYGFVSVPGTDWFVSAGIQRELVVQRARAGALNSLVIGCIVLVMVLILAYYISRRISSPIVMLQNTASEVSRGAYHRRVRIAGPREIADVAVQFNAMLNAIEQHLAERIAREKEIHRLAHFDELTGLPNRRQLAQRIEEAIASMRQRADTGAVIYIDLDRFKNINDAHGHLAGDRFLQAVARRLTSQVHDTGTLARIGGDEFVVVATGLGSGGTGAAAEAMALGVAIRTALEQPFEIDGHASNSSASLGIALFPRAGDTSDTLLQEADIAMYQAKREGRNQVVIFEASMRQQITERLDTEIALRNAIGSAALRLHMQPQISSAGELAGAELLLRWNDPVRGPVSPATFIPLAEQSNLIVDLGGWVLEESFRIQTRLEAAGFRMPVSINVSPRQFRHPGFVKLVRSLIADTGANASFLVFEVTEGLLIEDLDATIARMRQLAETGIRFSIDDFGTGYSSLAYLQRLPLYELKIDRSFIQDIPGNPSDTAIVQSILGMANHLGLHVVAEGVETRRQADFLIASGCAAMQGYLFARPMPVEEWFSAAQNASHRDKSGRHDLFSLAGEIH